MSGYGWYKFLLNIHTVGYHSSKWKIEQTTRLYMCWSLGTEHIFCFTKYQPGYFEDAICFCSIYKSNLLRVLHFKFTSFDLNFSDFRAGGIKTIEQTHTGTNKTSEERQKKKKCHHTLKTYALTAHPRSQKRSERYSKNKIQL